MQAYGELCAQFYDLDKPAAPAQALSWLQSQLPAAPARCLAAMCGTGRFLVPLLRAGFEVDGVDASAAMLRICADRVSWKSLPGSTTAGRAVAGPGRRLDPANAQDRPDSGDAPVASVQLSQSRLEDFLPSGYQACFLAGGALSLLDDPAMVLARLRAALPPGGLLLFEFYPPAEAAPTGSTLRVHTREDGARIRLHTTARYDSRAQLETHTCRYELIESDKVTRTEDEVLRVRLYTPGQAEALATSAGFTPEVSHGEHGWWVRATR